MLSVMYMFDFDRIWLALSDERNVSQSGCHFVLY